MSDRESRGVRSQIFSQISIITHKRFYLRATKFGMMAHVSSSVFLGDHPRPRLIFHWGQGRKAENQGRTSEGRERNGLLGRGQQAPSSPAMRSGECCELPPRGLLRNPDRPNVFHHFQYSRWPLLTLNIVNCGLSSSHWGSSSLCHTCTWIWRSVFLGVSLDPSQGAGPAVSKISGTPTYAKTVWPKAIKFGTAAHVAYERVSMWSATLPFQGGRPRVPQILGFSHART